jgi:Flp pilus assembly protein TadD
MDWERRRMTLEEQFNGGIALCASGRFEEAVEVFRRCLELSPGSAAASNNLANALCRLRRFDEAAAVFRQALRFSPNSPQIHNNLGNTLHLLARPGEAIAAYRRAIELRPDFLDAHNGLGHALRDAGLFEQALVACRRAVELAPQSAEAHSRLADALNDNGQLDEAAREYERALSIKPDLIEARCNLGDLRLLRGDFAGGWPQQLWRLRLPQLFVPPVLFPQPMWNGEPLNGKRILLRCDRGFGDTLHLARYAQLVADRGGKVVLFGPPELVGLLRSARGVEQTADWNQPPPPVDVQCFLLSLPAIFKTELASIPANVPYVSADAALSSHWKDRLTNIRGFKVGLAWAGGVNPPGRSVPLAMLAELAGPKVWFCSLQKGEAAAQRLGTPIELTDCTDEIKDFADTAALIANLDLVISVDTAVAHLAGAMGKPVWVLLKKSPDWRWLLDRTDSPWYPTMRLFRQKVAGDWRTPIGEAAEALRGC